MSLNLILCKTYHTDKFKSGGITFRIVSTEKNSEAEKAYQLYRIYGLRFVKYMSNCLIVVEDTKHAKTHLMLSKNFGVAYFSYIEHGWIASPSFFDIVSKKHSVNVNAEVLAECLVRAVSRHNKTIFSGIYKAVSGEIVTFVDSKFSIQKYWSDLDAFAFKRKIKLNTAAQQCRYLLEKIIQEQMARKGVGCELSGGLDSSSITAIAACSYQQQGKRLPAFASVPPANYKHPYQFKLKSYDDRRYIDALSKQYDNLDVHYVEEKSVNYFELCQQSVFLCDFPVYSIANLRWLEKIRSKAQAVGVTTLLGGQYGNFTLTYEGDKYHKLDLVQALRRIKRWVIKPKIKGLTQLFDLSIIKEKKLYNAGIKVSKKANKALIDSNFQKLVEWRDHLLPCSLFEGFEQRYQVQTVSPLYDPDFVDFCYSLPNECYFQNKQIKSLVKESMKGLVPDTVLHRKTDGQQGVLWAKCFQDFPEALDQWLYFIRDSQLINQYLNVDNIVALTKSVPKAMSLFIAGKSTDPMYDQILYAEFLTHIMFLTTWLRSMELQKNCI